MRITPDIVRYEFIGTEAKISKSNCHGHVGISGKVVDETRNTFTILRDGVAKTIAKDSATFEFKFPDGTVVEIEGRILLGRPEDRLKKSIRRLW